MLKREGGSVQSRLGQQVPGQPRGGVQSRAGLASMFWWARDWGWRVLIAVVRCAGCAWETPSSIPDGLTCSEGERNTEGSVASLTECRQLCEADATCNFIYFQSEADRSAGGSAGAWCHQYRTCDAYRSPSLGGTNYQRVCTGESLLLLAWAL